MGTSRSMVLLTKGRPSLQVENIQRRLGRWAGCVFGSKDGDFVVHTKDSPFAMAKLAGEHLFMITLLPRSYWESEDSSIFLQGAQGDSRLEAMLMVCKGAVLIDSQVGTAASMPFLAKLTAAMMEKDTPVLILPTSGRSHLVCDDLRTTLVKARSAEQLLPLLLNFQVIPRGDGEYLCLTMGMQMFDLPDVAMRCTQGEYERVAAAVQSTAAYQAQQGKALPVGDTMTIPGLGDLTAVEAAIQGLEDVPLIELQWRES